MKAFDQFLRRFKRVRWLENRVGELEGDKADLRRDVADLEKANARLAAEAAEREFVFPPGHFYSPQTSRAEVAEVFAREQTGPTFAGLELNEAEQGRGCIASPRPTRSSRFRKRRRRVGGIFEQPLVWVV